MPYLIRSLLVSFIVILCLFGFLNKANANGFSDPCTARDWEAPPPIYQEVLNRLQALEPRLKGIKIHYFPKLKFENAMMCDNRVLAITGGEIKANHGDMDWIAGTLGHEAAHDLFDRFIYSHYSDSEKKFAEKRADLYGFSLAKRAGFNACKIKDYWARRIKLFGAREYDDHPGDLERLQYLTCRGKK